MSDCTAHRYFLPPLRTIILKSRVDDSLNPEPTDLPSDPAAEPVSPGHEPIDPLPEAEVDPDIKPESDSDEGK